MTDSERYERAMYRFFRHIRDQFDEQVIHEDMDTVSVEVCVSEFELFSDELGDKSDASRWNQLLEDHHDYLGTWPLTTEDKG